MGRNSPDFWLRPWEERSNLTDVPSITFRTDRHGPERDAIERNEGSEKEGCSEGPPEGGVLRRMLGSAGTPPFDVARGALNWVVIIGTQRTYIIR